MTGTIDVGGELAGALWQTLGLRAKCAFLLGVIGDENASPGDRTAAFVSLLDDARQLSDALTEAERARRA